MQKTTKMTDQRNGTALESPRPELRASAAKAIGREGMVTIWDDQGRYLGSMGVELWKHLLTVRVKRSGTRLPLPRWYRRWRRRRLLTKLTRLSQKLPGGYR